MKLINKTTQFETEELKAFLNKIAKGISTHNVLVIVEKPRGNHQYKGNVKYTRWGSYHYRNDGHKIRCKGIIRVGVSDENKYPYPFIRARYGEAKENLKVGTPLNLLGMIFLHELYGARLARNGKNHYEHKCDAWAYKRGKELGLFEVN